VIIEGNQLPLDRRNNHTKTSSALAAALLSERTQLRVFHKRTWLKPRKAEITQLQCTVCCDKDVARLQVTMDNASLMQPRHGRCDRVRMLDEVVPIVRFICKRV